MGAWLCGEYVFVWRVSYTTTVLLTWWVVFGTPSRAWGVGLGLRQWLLAIGPISPLLGKPLRVGVWPCCSCGTGDWLLSSAWSCSSTGKFPLFYPITLGRPHRAMGPQKESTSTFRNSHVVANSSLALGKGWGEGQHKRESRVLARCPWHDMRSLDGWSLRTRSCSLFYTECPRHSKRTLNAWNMCWN